MEKTEKRFSEDLSWLPFVLNPETDMPYVTDWSALYAFAEKQKIVGICSPSSYSVRVEQTILYQWLGIEQQIKKRCIVLNERIKELCQLLEDAEFSYCILKGQGNAEMYPEPLLRMSGDIDVWIDADEKTIQKYVLERFPKTVKSYKHIKFPVFDDVPVDVHATPLKLYSPKHHKRLQRWIEDNKQEQFEHRIHLTGIDKKICVPTVRFNAIYQLGHMLIHFFDEGIGFRHLVDYFYVLKGLNLTEEEREEIVGTLKRLGMMRFAKAVMWIENCILGLPIVYCIVTPDEKRGQQLLTDVLDGGNFGKYSLRYKGRTGFYWRGFIEARRLLSMMSFAPCEATFCLLRKVKTAVKHTWRNSGTELRNSESFCSFAHRNL